MGSDTCQRVLKKELGNLRFRFRFNSVPSLSSCRGRFISDHGINAVLYMKGITIRHVLESHIF
jgi:hypothetical protein